MNSRLIILNIMYMFCVLTCIESETSVHCNNTLETYNLYYHKGYCYLIGKEVKTFPDAFYHCKMNGGGLTDVTEDFDDFINETNVLKENQEYWTGTLWTTSLDKWIWANGEKHEPIVEQRGWFSYKKCASYHVKNPKLLLLKHCTSKLVPICKFDLTNDTDRCHSICLKVQEIQPSIVPEVNNVTVPTYNGTNVTNTINETEDLCECKQDVHSLCKSDADETIPIVPLVLGCLLFVSLVTNFLMLLQMMCKQRKSNTLNRLEKEHQISLIDILKVGGGELSPGETYEKMTFDNDTLFKSEKKKGCVSSEGGCKDFTDMNVNGKTKHDTDIEHKVEDMHGVGVAAEDQTDQLITYSTLDHSSAHFLTNDPSHIYGLESGSVHSSLDGLRNEENKNDDNNETLNIYSNVESSDD